MAKETTLKKTKISSWQEFQFSFSLGMLAVTNKVSICLSYRYVTKSSLIYALLKGKKFSVWSNINKSHNGWSYYGIDILVSPWLILSSQNTSFLFEISWGIIFFWSKTLTLESQKQYCLCCTRAALHPCCVFDGKHLVGFDLNKV